MKVTMTRIHAAVAAVLILALGWSHESAPAAQESEGFVLIARVEALIAGHGVDAACERAVSYAEAGADAFLAAYALDGGAIEAGVARERGAEQAVAGGQDGAVAVAVDGAAFEHEAG